MRCSNCNQDTVGEWTVIGPDGLVAQLCSLACLTEMAWKLREAQPKLSKSKQEDRREKMTCGRCQGEGCARCSGTGEW